MLFKTRSLLKLDVMINCLCYQIQVEIALCYFLLQNKWLWNAFVIRLNALKKPFEAIDQPFDGFAFSFAKN